MIFRGASKRIAEADGTPPAAGRPQSAGRRTGVAAAVGIAAFVTIAAMSLSAASAAEATTRTNTRDSSAGTGTHPRRSGLNHFGLSVPTLVGETAAVQASWLAAMKGAGITSVRVDADWSWVQPVGPTKFYWTDIDQEVKAARAAGMSVDLVIDDCPPWAALAGASGDAYPQPASATQYATFAAAAAARYAPQGVGMFEIGNEPNNAVFWQPKPNPAAYTADLVAAYAAIKKVDPSAFVISGGLAPEGTDGINISQLDFLKAMYADGAKGHFDALGYHPYSFPALPDTYEPWSAC